jgi:four helix bundle protein
VAGGRGRRAGGRSGAGAGAESVVLPRVLGHLRANAAMVGGKEELMTHTESPNTESSAPSRSGLESLDAYRVAVEFYRLLRQSTRGRRGHVVEQLWRAAESVVLNVAEAYPAIGADRARRFRIAGNEAAECHAGLDLMEIRGELGAAVLAKLRALLDRERAMLWRLGRR